MDLIRSIKTGNIRDGVFQRDLLQKLFYDVRDRFDLAEEKNNLLIFINE